MTKKDYELIANRISLKVFQAKTLAEYHHAVDERHAARQYEQAEKSLRELTYDLATDLKADNPRFNEDKFRTACFRDRPHE